MIRFLPDLKHLVLGIVFIGFRMCSIQSGTAQSQDNEINFDLIGKKKVKQFLHEHQISDLKDCENIQASWYSIQNSDKLHLHMKIYKVKKDIDDVWECYNNANPVESWEGRKIDFGLLVSKYSGLILYKSEGTFTAIDTGQVYFLNLRLMAGLYNLPVAFEIIDVNKADKIIEFSYIEGNVSKGKQIIQFIPVDDTTTQIIHRSYFYSGSKVRDYVYPYYHRKIISGFHRNMKHLIKTAYI